MCFHLCLLEAFLMISINTLLIWYSKSGLKTVINTVALATKTSVTVAKLWPDFSQILSSPDEMWPVFFPQFWAQQVLCVASYWRCSGRERGVWDSQLLARVAPCNLLMKSFYPFTRTLCDERIKKKYSHLTPLPVLLVWLNKMFAYIFFSERWPSQIW